MGEEEKGAAHIHGVVEDVEGEAGDLVRHQDAKVVAQEGACGVRPGQTRASAATTGAPVIPSCRNEVMTNVRPTAAATQLALGIEITLGHTQGVGGVEESGTVQLRDAGLRLERQRVPKQHKSATSRRCSRRTCSHGRGPRRR